MAVAQKMDIQLKKCITPEARASFPAVFKPKSFQGQEAKYSIVLIFDEKTDLAPLKRAVKNAIVEQFGEDKSKWPKKLRMPFRAGDEREGTEGYGPGKVFVTATSKSAPGLVDGRRERIISEEQFYAGCDCRAEMIAFYYDVSGNKGVSFSLQNLQKIRDNTPFSGRKKAEDVFDAIDDGSNDASSYSEGSDDMDLGI